MHLQRRGGVVRVRNGGVASTSKVCASRKRVGAGRGGVEKGVIARRMRMRAEAESTTRPQEQQPPELLPRPARPGVDVGKQGMDAGGVRAQSMDTVDALGEQKRVVTIEEQREVAKDLIQYFKEQSLLQASRTESILGWTRRNEITNGRWVMFGILVGLLTEYATGVNFVDQIKITISNLGIADIYE